LLGVFTKIEDVFRFLPVGDYPVVEGFNYFENTFMNLKEKHAFPSLRIVDVRHGKVLMHSFHGRIIAIEEPEDELNSQANVLCVAKQDHNIGSRNLPFKIIWIATGQTSTMVYTFTSATSSWECSMYVLETVSSVEFRPGTIIGDMIYWVLKLKHQYRFSLTDGSTSCIKTPPVLDAMLRRNVHVLKIGQDDVGIATFLK
jgi:hypothetical protein